MPKNPNSKWQTTPSRILSKWDIGYSNPCEANIYQGTKFDKTFSFRTDMWPKLQFNLAAATILNLT